MKNLLLLAGLMLLVSAMAFAQNSAVASAIFTIENGLIVEGTEDADWGVLAPGTSYTVTPSGIIVPPNTDGNEVEPMYWLITTSGYGNIQVSIVLPSFFLGEESGSRIPFAVLSNSGGWFLEEPAIDIAYVPFDPRVPFTGQVTVDGEAYVGLGGVLTIPGTVPPFDGDTYRGTAILTAAYAGF
jgi:hypothetical protein